MQKKSWAGLSAPQKIGIIVMGAIQVGLLVIGLWDVAHRKPEELRGDRRFWVGFMFVNWIGPLTYFVYGRKHSPLPGRGRKAERPVITEEEAEIEWPFGF